MKYILLTLCLLAGCSSVQVPIEEDFSQRRAAMGVAEQHLEALLQKDIQKAVRHVDFPLWIDGKMWERESFIALMEREIRAKKVDVSYMLFLTARDFTGLGSEDMVVNLKEKGVENPYFMLVRLEKEKPLVLMIMVHKDGQWRVKGISNNRAEL